MSSRLNYRTWFASIALILTWAAPALHAQDFVASLAVADGQGLALGAGFNLLGTTNVVRTTLTP